MRRMLCCAGLVLVTALFALPAWAQANAEPNPMLVFEQAAGEVSAQVLASPKVKALNGGVMLVAPMDVAPPDQEDHDVYIAAEMTRTKLAAAFINGVGRLEVLDQVVLAKAMQELKLDAKGLADPDNWPVLSQQTGAQYLLLSTLTVAGIDAFSLDARLVDLAGKHAIGARGVLASVGGGIVPSMAGQPAQDLLVIAEWTLPGFEEGQLIDPTGLALDPAGNIYVTEARRGVVQKFDSKGKLLLEWGAKGADDEKLHSPTAVAVDHQGRVIVTDKGQPAKRGRIRVYSNDGKLLKAWGESEDTPNPSGVVADREGNIFVIDRLRNCLMQFDGEGTLVSQLGQQGGWFNAPTYLAMSLRGEIYIAEHNVGGIQSFENRMDLVHWGTKGEQPGEILAPRGLAVDPEGNVFLIDDGAKPNRLQEFTSQGKLLQELRLPFGPVSALAINMQGQLIIATRLDGKVRVVELMRK